MAVSTKMYCDGRLQVQTCGRGKVEWQNKIPGSEDDATVQEA